MKEEGMDEQSGFKANRGTVDGLFATSQVYRNSKKRKEHNLGMWLMFVGLVTAFDTVLR
jgi:hypothetical protein